MTLNTWLSSLLYAQKPGIQRSQFRAEKKGGCDGQDEWGVQC